MKDERVAGTERAEVLAELTRALDQGDLALDDYDYRVAAVGTATYTSELLAQLSDLPPEYAWLPPTAVAPPDQPRVAGAGRGALILGILSLPTSFCIFGGILGVIAIFLSLRGERARGFSPAMLGCVFGIVGVALSFAALAALVFALNKPMSP
ncbi:DUF1707 domain-containing protein [Actinoplanes sp. NBRC 103695]|uniref:DUF1707 SHOCT-like domain-containing protein n=1 Tax=Actinoplanes sp. NBRC 103695 TaxID=3032202 RepID=UPI0025578317|nr:DUF1707 domain-containing protein [Actinoplanes sp. NBRC 103695]